MPFLYVPTELKIDSELTQALYLCSSSLATNTIRQYVYCFFASIIESERASLFPFAF